jgi:hypothetical protein
MINLYVYIDGKFIEELQTKNKPAIGDIITLAQGIVEVLLVELNNIQNRNKKTQYTVTARENRKNIS